jgi:AAHS family benzoate transporter-like MFS transporter
MATPTQAVLYLLIFLAGTGAQGGLVVLNSVVDRSYPPWLRAQALGLTLGIGRIGTIIAPSVVGLIVGQSTVGSFSLFASCAVAAAILIALARRSQGLKRVTEMEGGNVMPAQNSENRTSSPVEPLGVLGFA